MPTLPFDHPDHPNAVDSTSARSLSASAEAADFAESADAASSHTTPAPKLPIIPPQEAGKRLDAALAELLPHLGLRGRRRLWEHGRVLLDGRERGPAHRVAGGESVTLELSALVSASFPEPTALESWSIRVVAYSPDYVALYKPVGLHSAALAGGSEPSLEALLPSLWPGFCRNAPGLSDVPPQLLSRLDAPTSGLITAACNPAAADNFRRLEAAGAVRKHYLALVHGRLEAPLLLTRRTDTDQRKKTRVLAEDSPDPTRHTRAEPLRFYDLSDTSKTLVHAEIRRGSRHQIRAHLAAAGHPLVGDALYGGEGLPEDFLLCLYKLELPGFTAELEEDECLLPQGLPPFKHAGEE